MTDEIIDKAALDRLLAVIGGDPEDLQELLEEFETSTPDTLAKMQAAAAEGDLEALRISVHSLKSNGRDFGATRLAAACEALEQRCKARAVEDPQAEVVAIAALLAEARAALAETAGGA